MQNPVRLEQGFLLSLKLRKIMSTVQTLKTFKILRKHFQNEEDSIRVVENLQQVIDNKFEEKKTELATKHDVNELKLASQKDIDELRVELINKLNDHFKWTRATLLSVGTFIVALIK